MKLFLGIDIGTTRTKLVVWDSLSARVVTTVSAPTPSIRADVDHRDHDAVWSTVEELMGDLSPQIRATIRGIAVASVGEEIVLLDAHGRSLAPTPCWYTLAERRQSPTCDRTIMSWQLFSDYRDTDPELLRRAAGFTDIASAVAMRMAGLDASAAFMDLSHASRTGLLGPDGSWSSTALEQSGAALTAGPPTLVESGTRIADIARPVADAWGLPQRVSVHAGGHDHFCGALAAGADEVGDVFVSVGTSESIAQLIPRPLRDDLSASGEHGFYVTDDLAYLHRSQPSGRSIAALLEAHGSADLDDLYEELSSDAPQAITPAARSLEQELQRQAVDSAATIDALVTATAVPARRIIIGGVPTATPYWRGIRAAELDDRAIFVESPELAGTGAAMLAARNAEDGR
jgi:sugar (pentulose or hexulose) kinase